MKYCTDLKSAKNTVLVLLPVIAIWPTSATKFNYADKKYSDTTYTTSTFQLKSDKIPDSVFKMKDLWHLTINGMDCDYGDKTNCWMIKEIPAEIKNLKNLKTIRLTLNAFSTIPRELTELHNLILLDFSDNAGFANIDNLTEIQRLQFLYLYGCGLSQLPKNVGDLKNLKELGLVGNNLSKNEQERIRKALPNCTIRF
jgi:Leucine-rich repeat (LRR) protein